MARARETLRYEHRRLAPWCLERAGGGNNQMTDQQDFAVVERPDWLEALARRGTRSSTKGSPLPSYPERAARIRTLIKALVIRDGFEAQAVIVRNISLNGMGIASRVLRPRTGEMLRIRLPGQHELDAEVRWAGEDAFGVLLSRRLDLAGVQAACRRRNSPLLDAVEKRLRDDVPPSAMRAGRRFT